MYPHETEVWTNDQILNSAIPTYAHSLGAASIVIACYPQVLLGTDLQELRDDLQARIKDVVERLTGLSVERINVVRVRYDRTEDRRLMGS